MLIPQVFLANKQWKMMLQVSNLSSMSRRGNCWDNAVAESFFSNLKSEKIKKRIYKTRQEARSEVFEYIEGFYKPVRRHKHLDQLSPLEFERRQIAL